ncbi:MAG: CPXCG motif-containing cysteine-rich protein [Chlorobiaceae bacterium]|nr:CPXCG motif-containing cysteine-rich protein [Chlorobiaceae bacterium]NTW74646.1 CPXCG motif-containing cysteine-rich protein [Chlorobiaceae bacterium]
MNTEQMVEVQCPYCAESFEVLVDCSLGHQEYVEECEVCNRPVELVIDISPEGEAAVQTRGEDV